jgi:serine/threonine-protein phosphatase 2B catalytic subunit
MTQRQAANSDSVSLPTRPLRNVLGHHSLFQTSGSINTHVLSIHFKDGGLLLPADACEIISRAIVLFSAEPNCLAIDDDVTICGDLHGIFVEFLRLSSRVLRSLLGCYFDIFTIIPKEGALAQMSFLFLGNYINRGLFGCELLLYLLALKITYPSRLFMLRGCHECDEMARRFNFFHECLSF